MTSPTIRIRLAQQPPLYFVAAVVLASLLPVLFQFVPDGASVVALQRLPKLVAASVALDRIDVPPLAVLDGATFDTDGDEREDDVVILAEAEASAPTEPAEPAPARAQALDPDRAAKPRAVATDASHEPAARRVAAPTRTVRSHEQRGKAACAAGNKTAARNAYRALPIGDDGRRTIRKACRESGILIL